VVFDETELLDGVCPDVLERVADIVRHQQQFQIGIIDGV
jgi:hypothetical protein